jgi:hypothetical protein
MASEDARLGLRTPNHRPMHATNPSRHAQPPPPAVPALAIHPPAPYRVTASDRARRSERALAAERRIGRAAYLLDDVISVPGTPIAFGLDPIIGLVPFVGDAVSALVSAWIVIEAARFQLPRIVIARMVMNALLDFGIGLLPFVGDLVDFGFKGNRRNLELFHRHAVDQDPDTRGSKALMLSAVALVIGVIWLLVVLLANLLSTVVG